jgi:hypothetical protein
MCTGSLISPLVGLAESTRLRAEKPWNRGLFSGRINGFSVLRKIHPGSCAENKYQFISGKMNVKNCQWIFKTFVIRYKVFGQFLLNMSEVTGVVKFFYWEGKICGKLENHKKITTYRYFKLVPPNQGLAHGSPTRGPPGCIMQPAVTYLNFAHITKFHHNLGS